MAKSVSEYYDLLIAEKEQFLPSLTQLTTPPPLDPLNPPATATEALLVDINTPSRASRWRLMVWLMAFALHIHEVVIEQLAATTESGTPLWYQKKALAFQYGDSLEIIDNKPQYPTITPANQIIKLAALAINMEGLLVFKVSKLDSAGEPTPLTIPEQQAFMAYINQVKFAGTLTDIISLEPDDLKIAYRVIYDPLIVNDAGELIGDTSVKPVKDAIETHLKNLPYNGFLYLDKLDDSVQAAKGVIHAIRLSARAKKSYLPDLSSSYVDIEGDLFKRYNPEAGYLRIHTLVLDYQTEP